MQKLTREYLASIENLRIYLVMEPPDTTKNTDPACITSHSHSYHELFVCGSGNITLTTEHGEIVLSRGESLLIPATYPHRKLKMSADTLWYSIGFTYTKKIRPNAEDLYSDLEDFDRSDIIRKYIDDTRLFTLIRDIYLESDTVPKHIPVMKLYLVLMYLKAQKSIDISIGGKDSGLHGKTKLMSLMSYLDYFVNQKFTESITEAEIAKRLYISERQLARIARERYGMTLHRAILEKRISTAATLLKESNRTVEQISAAVGFQSKTCFYREFVKKYGMTPMEYRKGNSKL